jgi:predicted peptidase
VDVLAKTPIWAFHGAKDEIVPLGETLALTDRLRALDANPRVTVYPSLKHDSWTRAYNDPELWKWMFRQRLQS